jgi:hypothetical protein
MRGKKIVQLSKFDYCGSGYRIAEAVNTYTNNFVDCFVMFHCAGTFKRHHAIGFQQGERSHVISPPIIERVNNIIKDADVIQFKGDFLPNEENFPKIKIPDGIPVIVSVHGSFFRRGFDNVSRGMYSFDEYKAVSDIRTVGSADLNYPDFDARLVPIPYPTHLYENIWKRNKIPIISHSPSYRSKKGTNLLEEAQRILKGRGIDIILDIITGVSVEECIERKAKSDIFFDQINSLGFYGNSLAEAIAMGIPSISYISDKTISMCPEELKEIPDINCGNTAESLANKIESLLKSDLQKFSNECYEWCEKHHSYKTLAKTWSDIYVNAKCKR